MMEAWHYAPAALTYIYWHRKERFQLASDTDEAWLLFAVTEGRFRFAIEDAEGEAGFGDLVFCPPGAVFRREALGPLNFHFYRFRWQPAIPDPQGDARAERSAAQLAAPPPPQPRPVGRLSIRNHDRLSSAYAHLERCRALGLEEDRQLAVANAVFQDLWQLLCLETDKLRTMDGRKDELMEEAERWIRQHAFGPMRLRDFSDVHGLSPVQFTRRYRAAWGRSPIEHTTSLRLEKARRLLLETGRPLDDIAQLCGYENGFYLSRIFTRKMKISPSRFRQDNRL